ncbi:unnamed protein product [Allacma fusca]|uniref:BACK domain-containing protein n=1 Tax=Allacma fusca TaxID=39272 RepID=A0A8J2L457_9HEXA|nr:unnamed protein product [Allacma fusca]
MESTEGQISVDDFLSQRRTLQDFMTEDPQSGPTSVDSCVVGMEVPFQESAFSNSPQGDKFLESTFNDVSEFLKADTLPVDSELDVYKALLRWGVYSLKKQSDQITTESMRNILSTLISAVRFPNMSKPEIRNYVLPLGLLFPEQTTWLKDWCEGYERRYLGKVEADVFLAEYDRECIKHNFTLEFLKLRQEMLEQIAGVKESLEITNEALVKTKTEQNHELSVLKVEQTLITKQLNETKYELNESRKVLNQMNTEMFQTNTQLVQTKAQLVQTKWHLAQTDGQLFQTKGQRAQTEGQLVQTKEQFAQTGGLVKTEGQLVQTEGQLVQTEGQLVQTEGQLVQTEGQLVQMEGQLVQTNDERVHISKTIVQMSEKLVQAKEEFIRANKELIQAKEDIKQTKRGLDKTNEELHLTKEGLFKTNEELHLTNGELGKTNEELHLTKKGLDKTIEELDLTKVGLGKTNEELHLTKHRISKTTEELHVTQIRLVNMKTELSKANKELHRTREGLCKTKEELNCTIKDLFFNTMTLVRTSDKPVCTVMLTNNTSFHLTDAYNYVYRSSMREYREMPAEIRPNTTKSFGFKGHKDLVAGYFAYCIGDKRILVKHCVKSSDNDFVLGFAPKDIPLNSELFEDMRTSNWSKYADRRKRDASAKALTENLELTLEFKNLKAEASMITGSKALYFLKNPLLRLC